ncbi:hypothetical protein CKK33_02330 [Mucilaginibacter sp. MD40]|uniref:hypothetical protein n=1 Tax=Mucilaginibacter sp. MD40 TaxID=2029590 RepID=UPI000BAC62BC|nr:hypothetical protein [Mucilaginibacter sp. MD40]PAW92392.1 hypothetical protein CKK33_02330 [Mucilaginibacter sp. MD40]
MKKILILLFTAAGLSLTACGDNGNPEGAMGINDKPDSTAFDKNADTAGRSGAAQDTSDKNIGPGKNDGHVTDSEDKLKHK